MIKKPQEELSPRYNLEQSKHNIVFKKFSLYYVLIESPSLNQKAYFNLKVKTNYEQKKYYKSYTRKNTPAS